MLITCDIQACCLHRKPRASVASMDLHVGADLRKLYRDILLLMQRPLPEPPSPDDAVLAWMATLREDCPSPDTPRLEQLAQAVQQRSGAAPPSANVESAQPISSVRAAAMRIEGQMAGIAPPVPGESSVSTSDWHWHHLLRLGASTKPQAHAFTPA